MSWIPLPFPKCPSCGKSWSVTYHRDCPHKSEIEVETLRKRSRCSPCNQEWATIDSMFYCSCGYSFSGREVETAINKTLELKETIAKFLKEMDFDEQKIERVTKDSLISWLNNASYQLGKTLGHIAGTVVSIIAKIFS